mmetsp:Transcript_7244/g.18076  ORF Transcript_7244/g.18076 Transcript_7244/m.18076 type:complete len:227 (+) Transcript_7244:894-1574(+)
MPASRAATSSANVEMEPSISSIAVSEFEMESSKPFLLSSDSSNCWLQYSFFASSSICSRFKLETISSIIAMTFSKPIFLPLSASEMRSKSGREAPCDAFLTIDKARPCATALFVLSCTKLALVPGNVFLKSSSASSSFKTLIVSARATNSSARNFLISSHSCVLVSQLLSSSSWNFSSSPNAALVFSSSLAMPAILTPRSAILAISSSICAVSVASSFFLAAISAS